MKTISKREVVETAVEAPSSSAIVAVAGPIDPNSDPPLSYSADEIYFYDSLNQYFLFSCDNSSKKAIAPHTNEALIRRAADLDRLSSLKCDRNAPF